MYFTIERKRLIKMLETVRRKPPGKKKWGKKYLRLYACAARVFTEANDVTAGEEALVLADGGCVLELERFLALVKTYDDKENLTIQADERALHMFGTTWPIVEYTRKVSPPVDFVVGPVTDTWVGSSQAPSQPPRRGIH
jgi:hypothetical protein